MHKIISFLNSTGSLSRQATKREKLDWCRFEIVSQMVIEKRKPWVDESFAYKVDVTTVHCVYIMCTQRIKNSGVKWCGKSCKLNKLCLGVFPLVCRSNMPMAPGNFMIKLKCNTYAHVKYSRGEVIKYFLAINYLRYALFSQLCFQVCGRIENI